MFDFFMVLGCGILGLIAHGATNRRWLEWLLRALIFLFFGGELFYTVSLTPEEKSNTWVYGVVTGMTGSTGLLLLQIFRQALSSVLTIVDGIVSGRVLMNLIHKRAPALMAEPVFSPTSIPHMVGLFIYIQTLSYLLGVMSPHDFAAPGMPLSLPVQVDQLLSYNGIGLVLLAFCGVGFGVKRAPLEALKRLALVKPTAPQVGIGILLIIGTFLFDGLFSLLTHNMHQDLGNKLAGYNQGTFGGNGGMSSALILSIATGLCAGIGEETLIRGALQPVFGIFPAAFLHGVLHGQFGHAPIFIVQVAIWSTMMGIVKRYTNTTTTIIGHVGYNLITVFMFAFNPTS